MKTPAVITGVALLLGGCASSSVVDVDSSTIMVSTSAAPVCGQIGAQQVAVNTAAIETLRRGYDRYIIIGGQAQNNVGVVGYTPIVANTYSNGSITGNPYGATYSGTSNTYVSGGQPIIAGSHDQQLAVKMFHAGEPGAEKAVDARAVLGPKWRDIAAKGPASHC